jgi:hypothetical protein
MIKFTGKELGVNMRKLVRDCLLLCVLEHSRLIMDLFEQRRTSSIKARKMAYQEREGEKKKGGGDAIKFMIAIWSRKLTLLSYKRSK